MDEILPVQAESNVHVHCMACADFVEAAPLAVEDEEGDPSRHWYYEDQSDIGWIRRRRLCLACGANITTGEIDETLIAELRALRIRVSDLKADLRRVEAASTSTKPPSLPSWLTVAAPDVPKGAVEELVRSAAWWIEHPTGSPCRAPGKVRQIEHNFKYGWVVNYGANKFAAAYAIHQAGRIAAKALEQAAAGSRLPYSTVRRQIYDAIWGSVLNHEGELFPHLTYRKDGDHLIFGTHSINIDEATTTLIRASGFRG
jgi:hypothetical protein